MSKNLNDPKNLKEEILEDVVKVNNAPEIDEKPPVDKPQHALDDARRVKVLSPSRLVFKRFVRNKLAVLGFFMLAFMFFFSFLGSVLSPYGESETFNRHEVMIYDYAFATYRDDYPYYTPKVEVKVSALVRARIQSYIASMQEDDLIEYDIENPDSVPSTEKYRILTHNGGESYILQKRENVQVATLIGVSYEFDDESCDTSEFKALVEANKSTNSEFDYDGRAYSIESGRLGRKLIFRLADFENAVAATNYFVNAYAVGQEVPSDFLYEFAVALGVSSEFSVGDSTYEIKTELDTLNIYLKDETEPTYFMDSFILRSRAGVDEYTMDFKEAVKAAVLEIKSSLGLTQSEFIYEAEILTPIYGDVLDENGEIIGSEIVDYESSIEETTFILFRNNNDYTLQNEQSRYILDVYASPSTKHWLGTDGSGMDVLTRIMYGGRISLTIGFIVILIELLLGVIMGGLAGFFGKWVDGLIMRIVDIFNCLPFLPLLIILGSVMDKLMIDPIIRIIWLMAILGFMGWSGIARMVRGQILSLREQDFMTAAEAMGLRSRRRIFRHLIPNVMPQLIVSATMGLGGVVLLESTLSFLGLGAKYPMATWGSIINSVSTAFALRNYVHIWLPVGLLICLTVVAFNFVGDGLRDALDPKMKR